MYSVEFVILVPELLLPVVFGSSLLAMELASLAASALRVEFAPSSTDFVTPPTAKQPSPRPVGLGVGLPLLATLAVSALSVGGSAVLDLVTLTATVILFLMPERIFPVAFGVGLPLLAMKFATLAAPEHSFE